MCVRHRRVFSLSEPLGTSPSSTSQGHRHLSLSRSCWARPLEPVGGAPPSRPGEARWQESGPPLPQGRSSWGCCPLPSAPSHLGHGAGHHPPPRRLLAVLTHPGAPPPEANCSCHMNHGPGHSPWGSADREAAKEPDSPGRGPPGASGKVRGPQRCPGPLGGGGGWPHHIGREPWITGPRSGVQASLTLASPRQQAGGCTWVALCSCLCQPTPRPEPLHTVVSEAAAWAQPASLRAAE